MSAAVDSAAVTRGFCIQRLREALAARKSSDALTRRIFRLQAFFAVRHLRELGPGEVVMPDGAIGEPVEWLGCDSCDGDGRKSFNDDGADVEGFCSWCPTGVAAERRYLRRSGLGQYARDSALDGPRPRALGAQGGA